MTFVEATATSYPLSGKAYFWSNADVANWHNNRVDTLFLDSHVETLPYNYWKTCPSGIKPWDINGTSTSVYRGGW